MEHPRPTARVLVVDDEAALRRAMARLLRGCSIVLCDGATSALAVLSRGDPFDVVFCDVSMPGMNGIELYEQIAVRRPDLVDRVVFVTGGATSAPVERFLRAKGRRTIEKPFSAEALANAIASVTATVAHAVGS